MTEKNKNFDNFFARVFRKFSQFCFLSVKNANENVIWESASSCAFGFIFSFIPVVLIIFTVLVTVLKISPEILNYAFNFVDQFKSFYDFEPLLNALLRMKSVSLIEVFLALWVIWMARKLFYSIVRGINRIFRSATKRISFTNQIFSFISEFVLVLIFILVVLFSFLFNKLNQLPFFKFITSSFPILFSSNSNKVVIFLTYFLFFSFTVYSYKFLSGTKPGWKICIFYAAISSSIMFCVSFFINKFMHFTNYNIVYGTVSTVIVFLFKVYIFFGVFLFFAQTLYVSEFFENLILCELYSSQNVKRNKISSFVYSKLFKNPVLSSAFLTKVFKNNEKIFSPNDDADFVFYLKNGIVLDIKDNFSLTYKTGDFFGENCIILNKKRKTLAVSVGECEICFIPKELFKKILKDYPKLGKITLTKLKF